MARLTNEDLAIKLAEISVKIDNIKEDLQEIKPLEKRIEALENFRSSTKGAATIGGGIFSLCLAIISSLVYHFLNK